MRKNSRLFRLWIWFAVRILKVPFTINFTPPYEDTVLAIGFAWTEDAALKMRANYATPPPKLTRAARRQLGRAADKAARREVRRG